MKITELGYTIDELIDEYNKNYTLFPVYTQISYMIAIIYLSYGWLKLISVLPKGSYHKSISNFYKKSNDLIKDPILINNIAKYSDASLLIHFCVRICDLVEKKY